VSGLLYSAGVKFFQQAEIFYRDPRYFDPLSSAGFSAIGGCGLSRIAISPSLSLRGIFATLRRFLVSPADRNQEG
jgi:hypothetical protein